MVIVDGLKSLGGLIGGLIIALAGIVAGVFLIINDKSTQGMSAILLPLVAIVGAFVYQKHRESKQEKNR